MDSELLRAAALSKCFRVDYGSKNIVLSVEDLTSFVHDTARGPFQVILPVGTKTEQIRQVKLPITRVEERRTT
jgi:hypothetical protein